MALIFPLLPLTSLAADSITISGNIVAANGIPIVIRQNGNITSIYDGVTGDLLSGNTDVSDKWIFGGWNDSEAHSGETSVTVESGVITKNVYGGSCGGTLNGDTHVVINGGTVGWVYGGGENSTLNGTAHVTVNPGAKIWGSKTSDSALADRGTVFGGGLNGTVTSTDVQIFGGDFGWAYGGGGSCTVGSTHIQLLGAPEDWCNVYGGGNGGRVQYAHLEVRDLSQSPTLFLYGGGWNDATEQADITIGGNCNLPASDPIYAANPYDTSGTVGSASFTIDHFELFNDSVATATTVCGPLVGTGVTGDVTVCVTGSGEPSKQLSLYLQDIDELAIDHSCVAPFGYDASDTDDPQQPLKLDGLDIDATGAAVFATGNTSVEIGTLSGSGSVVFSSADASRRPCTVTVTDQVDASAHAPLKLFCEGTDSGLQDMVFFNGAGIAALDSASCFLSQVYGKSTVKTDQGIVLADSSTVKTPTNLQATFDQSSYEYGSYITASISLQTNAGEPVSNELVKIQTATTGTPLASAVLDSNGTAEVKIPVNTALRDYGEYVLNALYEGSDVYSASTCHLTLKTDPQTSNITITDANIQLAADIAGPILNQTPQKQLDVPNDAFYTAELVWNPQTTVFQPDIAYTVSIRLSPKQGYDMNSVSAVSYQGQAVTPELQADGTLLLPDVKTFSPLDDDMLFETNQEPLSTVPSELQEQFDSVEELQETLYQSLLSQTAAIPEAQVAHYDVQLQVSFDGGVTWEPATPGNFPKEGLWVTLPYPAGTGRTTHDFTVVHMFTAAHGNYHPGDVEFPVVEKTASGLRFKVYGLSPISVGWEAIESEPSGGNTSIGSSSGGSQTKQPETEKSKGWNQITNELKNLSGGETVTIKLHDVTELPGEVLDAIAGKNVTIGLRMGNGTLWTICGTALPENTAFDDLDMSVTVNTYNIPAAILSQVAGNAQTVQLTMGHSGEYGFDLSLTVSLGTQNAGRQANLYRYDAVAGKMVLETSIVIDESGQACLPVSVGAQYAIVIDGQGQTLPFIDVSAGAWYYDAVLYTYQNGLMDGTESNLFEPETMTTRSMITTILWRLEGCPVVNYAMDFDDVFPGSWYAEAVRWAASERIITGYDDGLFGPDDPVTREQIAAILFRYAQHKGFDATARADLSAYTDVAKVGDWALDAMSWAHAEGLILGTDSTTLSPADPTPRCQTAVILMRLEKALAD